MVRVTVSVRTSSGGAAVAAAGSGVGSASPAPAAKAVRPPSAARVINVATVVRMTALSATAAQAPAKER